MKNTSIRGRLAALEVIEFGGTVRAAAERHDVATVTVRLHLDRLYAAFTHTCAACGAAVDPHGKSDNWYDMPSALAGLRAMWKDGELTRAMLDAYRP